MAITSVDQRSPAAGAGVDIMSFTSPMREDTARITGPEFSRRVVILVFGLIQLVIVLRLILPVLGVNEVGALVSGVLDIGQTLVAPFAGVLGADALLAAGSMLDPTAIVALAGWTVIELVVLRAIGTATRETA